MNIRGFRKLNISVRFDLGRNTGLVHVFVDSNNVKNGVTYFYAVTAYDHGDVNAQIPPSETQRTIQRDAVTRQFKFDVNTAMVVPGGPAQGFVPPKITETDGTEAELVSGYATGKVWVDFLNPLEVKDNKKYDIIFHEVQVDSNTTRVGYSVIDNEVQHTTFTAQDTFYVVIVRNAKIVEGSLIIRDANGGSGYLPVHSGL